MHGQARLVGMRRTSSQLQAYFSHSPSASAVRASMKLEEVHHAQAWVQHLGLRACTKLCRRRNQSCSAAAAAAASGEEWRWHSAMAVTRAWAASTAWAEASRLLAGWLMVRWAPPTNRALVSPPCAWQHFCYLPVPYSPSSHRPGPKLHGRQLRSSDRRPGWPCRDELAQVIACYRQCSGVHAPELLESSSHAG